VFGAVGNLSITQSLEINECTNEEATPHHNAHWNNSERKRAAMVALLALGETVTRSAKATRSSRASAKKCWDAFAAHGVNGILNPSRKQKRSDRPEIQRSVFRILHDPPNEHGFNRTTWRLKDLNVVLRRQGTAVSEEVISAIIHSAGYQWKKARKVLTSNDPEYRQKLDHIKSILLGSPAR
jgi:transposase